MERLWLVTFTPKVACGCISCDRLLWEAGRVQGGSVAREAAELIALWRGRALCMSRAIASRPPNEIMIIYDRMLHYMV